jgi:hypothetical protein
VRVHRDRAVGKLHENHFGRLCKRRELRSVRTDSWKYSGVQARRTDGIGRAKTELQPICLVLVQWVVVEYFDVQEPFLEVRGRDQLDAWRQRIADLSAQLLEMPLLDS